MLLIVLLALAFAAEDTCPVYMKTNDDKTCGQCYGGNAVKDDKKDCVTPQSLMPGCVSPAATKDSCVGGCTDYYYEESSKCKKGEIENCVKYDSKDKCSYCKENYAVQVDKNDTSKSKCVESEGGCIEVDKDDEKKCIRCYGKIEDGKCKDNSPAITNCEVEYTDKTENGLTYCLFCKEGYYCNEEGIKCTSCSEATKIDNCKTYYKEESTVLCKECKEGYYVIYGEDMKNSTCTENDIPNCKEQNKYEDKEGNKKTCGLCENKYALKDGDNQDEKCDTTTIEYCKRLDKNGNCRECWSGYSLTDKGECKKCDDSNAISCSLDGKTSYDCKEDAVFAKNYALNDKNECEKVNSLASIKKYAELSASVSMTVMLFVVLFLLF